MARVLIIDDDIDQRRTMTRHLKRDGHEMTTASSVHEGSALLTTMPFDVVISAIDLPDCSGIELLESITARKLDVETILITETVSMHSVRAATWAGAYDYLVKPIPSEVLSKVVASAAKVGALRQSRPEDVRANDAPAISATA